MTKAEKEHYDKVARLGCSLCRHLGYGESPACLHHIRRAGIRAKSPIIPLCPQHHTGDRGIHGMGRKSFEREYGITEEELLEKTLGLI
jgi:hypothetical protein